MTRLSAPEGERRVKALREANPNFTDMTGRTFGTVCVIRHVGQSNGAQTGAKWLCKCTSCGKRFETVTQKLKRGCFSCNKE